MSTTTTREEQVARLTELGIEVEPGLPDEEVHRLLIRTLSDRLNGAISGEVEIPEETPGADLVLPRTDARPQIPTAAIWAHLATMAEPLAKSNLVKPALRGKPNDVLMILLTGYDLQITMTQALAKIHVIEGQPAASPELILGLIRREGHRVWPGGPENSGTEQETEDIRSLGGVVHAIRKDDPERIITVRFTVAQAEQAGLVGIDDAGKLRKRSSNGSPLPWEQYPEDLLWARAVSRLGRRNFSDVLLGLSYVPEELGFIDAASYEAPAVAAPDPAEAEIMPSRRDELRARIDKLPDDVKARLATAWRSLIDKKALHGIDHLLDREYDAASDLIGNYERRVPVAPSTEPPCEEDAELAEAKEQGALDLRRETGLPFPCEDWEQREAEVRTCPTPEQCAAAGECLLSPI